LGRVDRRSGRGGRRRIVGVVFSVILAVLAVEFDAEAMDFVGEGGVLAHEAQGAFEGAAGADADDVFGAVDGASGGGAVGLLLLLFAFADGERS
jgi:hypothetical protein